MTGNIFGWLILGALVVLIFLAIFGKRRVVSYTRSCPPKEPAGSGLGRFFAGVDKGIESGLLQMEKRPESIGHETYQKQEAPKYYSSAPAKTSVKKKSMRTISAPKEKPLLLPHKGLKSIIFGLVILSSLGVYAGTVSAQQILLGPDGQPVRQPGYQTQDNITARNVPAQQILLGPDGQPVRQPGYRVQDNKTAKNVSAPQILMKPNGQPVRQPDFQTQDNIAPEDVPAQQMLNKTDEQPVHQPDNQTQDNTTAENVPAQQILNKSDEQPMHQPDYQIQDNMAPEDVPAQQILNKTDEQPVHQPDNQTQDNTTAENVPAQQILNGSDGQPVLQPDNQTQDNTSNWFIWIDLAVLFMVGLGIYWAKKKEMVFFYDRTDMWVSIFITLAGGLLLLINKGWLIFTVAGGVIAYHFYCAYRYNPGNIAGAFIMAVSRIVIGVVVPPLALFILLRGFSREKDESAGAYAIRSIIEMAAKAAMLTGLFFFMRSLVNGEEVFGARGEAYHSDSFFRRASSNNQSTFDSRASSNKQSSETSSNKEYTSNDRASFRSSSKEKASSSEQESVKTASQEELSDYDILGVPKTADFNDIQRAYRNKVLKTHPDRVAKMGAKYRKIAEEECKKINAAFDRIRKARNYGFA